jgi:putative transposase
MKKSRFSEQQIAFVLRQAEDGTAVAEVCRKAGISEASFYNWAQEVRRADAVGDEAGQHRPEHPRFDDPRPGLRRIMPRTRAGPELEFSNRSDIDFSGAAPSRIRRRAPIAHPAMPGPTKRLAAAGLRGSCGNCLSEIRCLANLCPHQRISP